MFDVINFDMYNNERSKFRPPNPRKIIPHSSPLKIDFAIKLRLFNRLFDYQPRVRKEFIDGSLENQLHYDSETQKQGSKC